MLQVFGAQLGNTMLLAGNVASVTLRISLCCHLLASVEVLATRMAIAQSVERLATTYCASLCVLRLSKFLSNEHFICIRPLLKCNGHVTFNIHRRHIHKCLGKLKIGTLEWKVVFSSEIFVFNLLALFTTYILRLHKTVVTLMCYKLRILRGVRILIAVVWWNSRIGT
jgi:hypothetical protein